MAGMRWNEIDLAGSVWVIPAERTKNGEEHTVDLGPQTLAILAALPGERRGLTFSTTGKTSISGFSKSKARLDKLMSEGLDGAPKPWRLHDLRRTMATLMGEELEIDAGVIERILNHISGTQGGLQGIYQRQMYRQKRKAALLAWGAFIERLTSGDVPASNVVAFAGSR